MTESTPPQPDQPPLKFRFGQRVRLPTNPGMGDGTGHIHAIKWYEACVPHYLVTIRPGYFLLYPEDQLASAEQPMAELDQPPPKFRIDQKIRHAIYGEGYVTSYNSGAGILCPVYFVRFDGCPHPSGWFTAETNEAIEERPMIEWEYIVLKSATEDNYGLPSEEQLNRLGREGWELVTIVPFNKGRNNSIYLKRRKLRTADLDAEEVAEEG